MPFLPPNQQRQSTEGTTISAVREHKHLLSQLEWTEIRNIYWRVWWPFSTRSTFIRQTGVNSRMITASLDLVTAITITTTSSSQVQVENHTWQPHTISITIPSSSEVQVENNTWQPHTISITIPSSSEVQVENHTWQPHTASRSATCHPLSCCKEYLNSTWRN